MKPEELIKLWDQLKGDRGSEESLWQELYEYMLPRKADITNTPVRGNKKGTKVFDSTAVYSVQLLAASLQGSLTSTNVKWIGLKYLDVDRNEDDASMEALGRITAKITKALNESNFRLEIFEIFQDLVVAGTSCLYVEPVSPDPSPFDGLQFRAYPIQDYCVRENSRGEVDTVIRKICFTARQAVQEFGVENVGKMVLEATKKEPEQKFTFFHIVTPDEEQGNWKSVYVIEEDKKIVDEGFFNEFPYIVSRWSKIAGEMYGRSPAHTALADVRTLNKATEETLRLLPLIMQPPLLVPENTPDLDVRPRAMNRVRADLIPFIKPSPIHGDMKYGEIKVEELRGNIRRIFFSDQLQIQKQAQMTATESTITFELMQRLLGPVYSRMEIELFKPMIERVFSIMKRGGEFEEDLIEGDFEIEYMGPLARAQKMAENQAVQQWISGIAPLVEIKPEVLDFIDFDKYVVSSARSVGVPEEIIRDKKDVMAVRQARAESQQEMAEQEQQAQQVDMVSKLAKVEGFGG